MEEQCTVINQMIQTSGMLKKISSCMSKTYDVGQIYPLILELRHMVEQALWPYVNQATCLVADLDDIEKEQTIYNFLTHEVYENDTWFTEKSTCAGNYWYILLPNKENPYHQPIIV